MKLLAFLLAFASFARAASPDDQAKFLAGLPTGDPALAALERDPAWQEHASRLGGKYNRMDQRQLAKVRAWSAENLGDNHRTTGAVLYTFSGPDFLYPHTFFPNASPYILCGTEPVGVVPDIAQIPPAVLASNLENLRRSLDTMLTTHYFITKDMRADLTRAEISGTLPLLYIFLARSGCTIRNVTLSPGSAQIDFIGFAGRKQTLHYFKTDLSNGGGNGPFFAFCRQHAPAVSLVKSASYLMFGDSFSTVRNFLLQNSRLIIQDDSGIPLRAFDSRRWTLRYYGIYTAPVELFKDHFQPELADAYARSNPAPLGFAFGYAWQPAKGLLILATPK